MKVTRCKCHSMPLRHCICKQLYYTLYLNVTINKYLVTGIVLSERFEDAQVGEKNVHTQNKYNIYFSGPYN